MRVKKQIQKASADVPEDIFRRAQALSTLGDGELADLFNEAEAIVESYLTATSSGSSDMPSGVQLHKACVDLIALLPEAWITPHLGWIAQLGAPERGVSLTALRPDVARFWADCLAELERAVGASDRLADISDGDVPF